MSNFKTSIGKNLKPYTKYIPEIDKQTMRTLVKREKLSILFQIDLNILFIFSLCRFYWKPKIFQRSFWQRNIKNINFESRWTKKLRYLLHNCNDFARNLFEIEKVWKYQRCLARTEVPKRLCRWFDKSSCVKPSKSLRTVSRNEVTKTVTKVWVSNKHIAGWKVRKLRIFNCNLVILKLQFQWSTTNNHSPS